MTAPQPTINQPTTRPTGGAGARTSVLYFAAVILLIFGGIFFFGSGGLGNLIFGGVLTLGGFITGAAGLAADHIAAAIRR